MKTLREAATAALEAMDRLHRTGDTQVFDMYGCEATEALRAALVEPVQEPDLSRCPQCGGPADNGHDRSIPPTPYWCTKCMVEPVPDSKHATIAEWWADKQRKPPATIDEIFDRMNKAPKGVFYGHDPMTIWMEAWRAAEQHGIKDA